MSSVMQWPSEIGPKSLKAQNVAAAKLLISWGSMACTKNAGCFPRHLAINSILKRSLTRTGLPSTLEPVDLTNNGRRPDGLTLGPWYRGRSLVWDTTAVDTFAQGHYKRLRQRLVLRPQKLRSQNAKNIMTSKAITTFHQWQMRPLVCMANPLLLF